ncbi:MAG: caspase family protein, partial [Verrucomicrobiota bacterium]
MPPPTPPPPPDDSTPRPRPRNLAGGVLEEARKRLGARSRHALIIAPGTHEVPRLDLPAVPEDARAIRDLLLAPDCGCFPPGHVEVLEGPEANEKTIREKLDALAKAAGTDGLAFILFLGHAVVEENETYFVTHETRCEKLFSSSLSKHALQGCMRRFRTKYLFLVMDCCHAGQFADLLPQRTRSVLSGEDLLSQFPGEGRVILAAAGHDEKAVESQRGFLCQALEEGLRGEADTRDSGVVTLEDLWPFVNRRVAALGNQTPRLIGEFTSGFALSLNQAHTRQRDAEARRLQQATEALDRWTTRGPRPVRLLPEEADAAQRVLQTPDEPSDPPEHLALRQMVLQFLDAPLCPAAVKVLAYHVHCDQVHGPRGTQAGQLDGLKTEVRVLSERLLANKEESARLTRELETARQALQALELAREAREQELLQARDQVAQAEAARVQSQAAWTVAERQVVQRDQDLQVARQELARLGEARAASEERARAAEAQAEGLAAQRAQAQQRAETAAAAPPLHQPGRGARVAFGIFGLGFSLAILWGFDQSQRYQRESGERDKAQRDLIQATGELAQLKEEILGLEGRLKDSLAKGRDIRNPGGEGRPQNTGDHPTAAAGSSPLGTGGASTSPAQATRERPFTNTLGMRFVPLATNTPSPILFSVWETRVQDYAVFAQENPGRVDTWRDPQW